MLKTPSMSKVEMTELVLPQHTNGLGTIFGGVVLSWIDIAASICAHRHSGMVSVTASLDTMNFLAPIHLGDIVIIKARLTYVGSSSCEVEVSVSSEQPSKQLTRHTGSAFLTMVAVDEQGRPKAMPKLHLETKEEEEAFAAALARKEHRLKLRQISKK